MIRTYIRSTLSEALKWTVCFYLMVNDMISYKSTLADWVFQEADYETEICMQKCYSVLLLDQQWWEQWIKQIGQRKILGWISNSKGFSHSMGPCIPSLTSHWMEAAPRKDYDLGQGNPFQMIRWGQWLGRCSFRLLQNMIGIWIPYCCAHHCTFVVKWL